MFERSILAGLHLMLSNLWQPSYCKWKKLQDIWHCLCFSQWAQLSNTGEKIVWKRKNKLNKLGIWMCFRGKAKGAISGFIYIYVFLKHNSEFGLGSESHVASATAHISFPHDLQLKTLSPLVLALHFRYMSVIDFIRSFHNFPFVPWENGPSSTFYLKFSQCITLTNRASHAYEYGMEVFSNFCPQY